MGRKKSNKKTCAMWGCPNKRMLESDLCHNHFVLHDDLYSYKYHKEELALKKKPKGNKKRGFK